MVIVDGISPMSNTAVRLGWATLALASLGSTIDGCRNGESTETTPNYARLEDSRGYSAQGPRFAADGPAEGMEIPEFEPMPRDLRPSGQLLATACDGSADLERCIETNMSARRSVFTEARSGGVSDRCNYPSVYSVDESGNLWQSLGGKHEPRPPR